MTGIPYLPVALVCRMPDGQFTVLHGQAEVVETSVDWETNSGYRTTIEWRRGHAFTQLRMTDVPGVQVSTDGEQFRVDPVFDEQTGPLGEAT